MDEVVYIDEKNYKDFLNLDIVAFSFAYGGAQGSPGEILVLTKDAKMYSMNYAFGNMTIEMCDKVCPPVKDCVFGCLDVEKAPSGWEGFSLGAGNFLVLSDAIAKSLKEELLSMRPSYRYQSWRYMVRHWLQTNKK